ncbi:MAG TPA: VOC family protein [Polyangia bacterium]|nr:VOC family protein [Polyangia bacterium]
MTAPAPGGVHHLAIAVRDLPVATSFYQSVLGLPVLRRWPATDGGSSEGAAIERSVWLDLGGGTFLALERTAAGVPARDDQTPGLQMLALRVDVAARDEWERRFAGAGVPVVHRTAHTIYVRDPEGNRIGLSHWPDTASEQVSEGAPAGTSAPAGAAKDD